jgi:hypothetical protein
MRTQRIKYLKQLADRLKVSDEVNAKVQTAVLRNPWFIPEFVQYSVNAIVNDMLDPEKLQSWLSKYPDVDSNKTVALVFAGNLPLVGFHDFLCAYVAGCKIKIKLSSKDDELFPALLNILKEIDNTLSVELVETLRDFDLVIATGSNNTNRYFDYYFRNYPRILRKNRNAVAILTGEERDAELEALADDIFMYFGFGCRNVSKLYVPHGYDFARLLSHTQKYAWLHAHTKYMNNYDYNRTLLLLNKTEHLCNDFVMLVENKSIPSPIASVHFEYWQNANGLNELLQLHAQQIQCVVSSDPETWNAISSVHFGQSQHPQLWDYADGVDTLHFLLGQ